MRNYFDRRHDVFSRRSALRHEAEPFEADTSDDARYRPRRWQRSFGWARRRDVEDQADQEAAPHGRGRYDRTGEERYARGLEAFDAAYERPAGRSYASWGLDEGGVEFGSRYRSRDVLGPYRGRAPRGYQRSDERIREDVCDTLTEADDVDPSQIDVAVVSGTVTLTGTVENRYEKRRAEDLAESVSGVRDVQNHLRLQPGGAGGGRSATVEPIR